MSGNQYEEARLYLRSEIDYVKTQLAAGTPASEIANTLHSQGLGCIQITLILRESTGARLGDLKGLGQWWGKHGVTDARAFDEWAAKIFDQPTQP
jgi:hypothetical protein